MRFVFCSLSRGFAKTFVPVVAVLLAISTGQHAFANHSELQPGESEIVSRRFDGPNLSQALNGNSQLEDISADGRLVAFATAAGIVGATSQRTKSLIYDRLTGGVELFYPSPSVYQFGTPAENTQFSPVQRDNDV